MREFEIIARHFAPLAGPGGLGLLDDAAILAPPPGHDLVVTTDAVVAGVHFFGDDAPDSIGHKALAVNLSDLAAKGAEPLGFQLALMLPRDTQENWLEAFARGLGALAATSVCPLMGGDTVATSGPLSISITAFGSVPKGRMVPRGDAATGNRIMVTGTIGDGAIGLKARAAERDRRHWPLTADHLAHLKDRFLRPRARFLLAQAVQRHARAAMDISDGFVGDLQKMVGLSGHGADIWLDDVPHSVAARAAMRFDPGLKDAALTGGDDYEILACVPEENLSDFQAECLRAGVPATVVGVVGALGQPIRFLDGAGRERNFTQGSYSHGD